MIFPNSSYIVFVRRLEACFVVHLSCPLIQATLAGPVAKFRNLDPKYSESHLFFCTTILVQNLKDISFPDEIKNVFVVQGTPRRRPSRHKYTSDRRLGNTA